MHDPLGFAADHCLRKGTQAVAAQGIPGRSPAVWLATSEQAAAVAVDVAVANAVAALADVAAAHMTAAAAACMTAVGPVAAGDMVAAAADVAALAAAVAAGDAVAAGIAVAAAAACMAAVGVAPPLSPAWDFLT